MNGGEQPSIATHHDPAKNQTHEEAAPLQDGWRFLFEARTNDAYSNEIGA